MRSHVVTALALALLVGGCGSSRDLERYRGDAFDVAKPPGAGWTLTADPAHFALSPAPAEPGAPDAARGKVAELVNRGQRSSIEIFIVEGGAATPGKVMNALCRRSQRRTLVEGEPKRMSVGGKKGRASIATWRQTGTSPKQCLYCVRVALGTALWCFVGSAAESQFDAARKDFKAVLKTVEFHR